MPSFACYNAKPVVLTCFSKQDGVWMPSDSTLTWVHQSTVLGLHSKGTFVVSFIQPLFIEGHHAPGPGTQWTVPRETAWA